MSQKLSRFTSIAPSPKATCRGVEIFAPGNFRGELYTINDLEKIAANFRTLTTRLKLLVPPIVLGHEETQDFLDRTDLPAAGWVQNVRVKGNKLVADFVDVPVPIAKAINDRTYRKVSAELYDDFMDDSGKSYGLALRRVGILGGEVPQVKSLADIPYATFSEQLRTGQITMIVVPGFRSRVGGIVRCYSEIRPIRRILRFSGQWVRGPRGGRAWLPAGMANSSENYLYGKAAQTAAAAAAAGASGQEGKQSQTAIQDRPQTKPPAEVAGFENAMKSAAVAVNNPSKAGQVANEMMAKIPEGNDAPLGPKVGQLGRTLANMIPKGQGIPSSKELVDGIRSIASAENRQKMTEAAKGWGKTIVQKGWQAAKGVASGLMKLGSWVASSKAGRMGKRLAMLGGAVGLKVLSLGAFGIAAAAAAAAGPGLAAIAGASAATTAATGLLGGGAVAATAGGGAGLGIIAAKAGLILAGTYASVKGFFAINRRANILAAKAMNPNATPEELEAGARRYRWDIVARKPGAFLPLDGGGNDRPSPFAKTPEQILDMTRGRRPAAGGVAAPVGPPPKPNVAGPAIPQEDLSTRRQRRKAGGGGRSRPLSERAMLHLFAWGRGPRGGEYYVPEGKADQPGNRLYGQRAKKAAAADGRSQNAGNAGGAASKPSVKPAGPPAIGAGNLGPGRTSAKPASPRKPKPSDPDAVAKEFDSAYSAKARERAGQFEAELEAMKKRKPEIERRLEEFKSVDDFWDRSIRQAELQGDRRGAESMRQQLNEKRQEIQPLYQELSRISQTMRTKDSIQRKIYEDTKKEVIDEIKKRYEGQIEVYPGPDGSPRFRAVPKTRARKA